MRLVKEEINIPGQILGQKVLKGARKNLIKQVTFKTYITNTRFLRNLVS
jgi:hypothetical protein